MEERTHPQGQTLYVDSTHGKRGSKAPFYVVYNIDRERWGFFCSNCESFDTAVDSMDRIKCNSCNNLHKAEQWDAAHE